MTEGIDLSFARDTVQTLVMTNRCTIMRPSDARDQVFNEITGTYRPGFDTLVSTDTPCMVQEQGASEVDRGGAPTYEKTYTVFIPYDSSEVRPGDALTITLAIDPLLQNQVLRVTNVLEQTVLVVRQLQCTRRVDAVTPH